MAVLITDECVNCGTCIYECPVSAIVDDESNPTGKAIHYVYEDKCIECESHHDIPACAEACPANNVIVWNNSKRGLNGEAIIS